MEEIEKGFKINEMVKNWIMLKMLKIFQIMKTAIEHQFAERESYGKKF